MSVRPAETSLKRGYTRSGSKFSLPTPTQNIDSTVASDMKLTELPSDTEASTSAVEAAEPSTAPATPSASIPPVSLDTDAHEVPTTPRAVPSTADPAATPSAPFNAEQAFKSTLHVYQEQMKAMMATIQMMQADCQDNRRLNIQLSQQLAEANTRNSAAEQTKSSEQMRKEELQAVREEQQRLQEINNSLSEKVKIHAKLEFNKAKHRLTMDYRSNYEPRLQIQLPATQVIEPPSSLDDDDLINLTPDAYSTLGNPARVHLMKLDVDAVVKKFRKVHGLKPEWKLRWTSNYDSNKRSIETFFNNAQKMLCNINAEFIAVFEPSDVKVHRYALQRYNEFLEAGREFKVAVFEGYF